MYFWGDLNFGESPNPFRLRDEIFLLNRIMEIDIKIKGHAFTNGFLAIIYMFIEEDWCYNWTFILFFYRMKLNQLDLVESVKTLLRCYK